MDKKTILAIVLCVAVILITLLIQQLAAPRTAETAAAVTETAVTTSQTAEAVGTPTAVVVPVAARASGTSSSRETTVSEVPEEADSITADMGLMTVIFSTRGGDIVSYRLNDYRDGEESVEMIRFGSDQNRAFTLHFGGAASAPVDAIFEYHQIDAYTHEFSRDFVVETESGETVRFTLTKTYVFKPDEYLFQLNVDILNSVREVPRLDFGGFSYTLGVGPQIGPSFLTLDGRREYRQFFYYSGTNNPSVLNPDNTTHTISRSGPFRWAAITGKYFSIIGVPGTDVQTVTFANNAFGDVPSSARMSFSRAVLQSSDSHDVFRFYIGPKTSRILERYNAAANNSFETIGLNLEKIIRSNILTWLEVALKFMLELFYKVIPNFGVAIIILTLFIKICLFPLNHASNKAMLKIKQLNPKMEEIKARYASNPQKMNQEVGELYRREKINPLSGCLPLLIQMPFLFAMYSMLDNYFDFRGAMFIPGWITDLSAPESIFNFASSFTIPLVNISDIRILPVIMIAIQFVSQKLMQTAPAKDLNMKLITYVLPLVFFVGFYNAPSGLVLYWTLQNILTVAQQLITNSIMKKKAALAAAQS